MEKDKLLAASKDFVTFSKAFGTRSEEAEAPKKKIQGAF